MYEYILGVVTSYAGGSLVQAEDPIRQEQAVALLSCRLERGGGIPVPMAWVPSVLGGTDAQTTAILGRPISKSVLPQWFYEYLVLC